MTVENTIFNFIFNQIAADCFFFLYIYFSENQEGSEGDRCPDKAKGEYRVRVRSPVPGESGIPGSQPSPPEQDKVPHRF